ncbi:hypothetical protein F5Y04DRAFT_259748, partial [Hypomontagnella monticulosa]
MSEGNWGSYRPTQFEAESPTIDWINDDPYVPGISAGPLSRPNRLDSILKGSQITSNDTSNSVPGPDVFDRYARRYKDMVTDTSQFAHYWEKYIVPQLVQKLLLHANDGFSVNVVRTATMSPMDVIIMTVSEISMDKQRDLEKLIRAGLPRGFESNLRFHFPQGIVSSLAGDNELARLDDICTEKNSYWYKDPMMGDSAGVNHQGPGGTLGPLLEIDGLGYWVVNCHILAETLRNGVQPADIELCQPSNDDYEDFCELIQEEADVALARPINKLGPFIKSSGTPFKTTRISLRQFGDHPHRVVTDWAAFRATGLKKNEIRGPPSRSSVRTGSEPFPGGRVYSSGRTTGFTQAYVSLVPAVVYPGAKNYFPVRDSVELVLRGNGTGTYTREWAVCYHEGQTQCPPILDVHNHSYWIENGIGVPGDSGSPIVGVLDGQFVLYGQVWGRNEYSDSELRDGGKCVGFIPFPRITYFTSYYDLCDDIQEKMGARNRPVLPSGETIQMAMGDRPQLEADAPIRSASKARSTMRRQLPERIRRLLYTAVPSVDSILKDSSPSIAI